MGEEHEAQTAAVTFLPKVAQLRNNRAKDPDQGLLDTKTYT